MKIEGCDKMTMVRISTKYPISAEDAVLLPPTKNTWWLRNTTTNTFVREFPRLACTEAFNVEVDLPDGEYTCGTGDWNVVNDAGKHVSQKIYFYIQGGALHYCKRTELPSVNGGVQPASSGTATTIDSFNPFGNTPAIPAVEYTKIEDSLYCADSGKFVTPDYNCITAYCPRDSTGLEECATCVHSRVIFYSNQA